MNLVLSAVLTWAIGLTPPLVIRFALLRRPLSKAGACVVAACFLVANLVVFVALGSESKTHGALFLVALASYAILRAGAKRHVGKAYASRRALAKVRGMRRPQTDFKCPCCGLINPPAAVRCDCGLAFEWAEEGPKPEVDDDLGANPLP